MKLTSQQAQVLLEVLRASLDIEIEGTFTRETRRKLYQDIINQQSNEIIDLEKGC